MSDIDAFILIGGRSSRLGSSKAHVKLGSETLAKRAFQTVSRSVPEGRVTFVAANDAQFGIEAIRSGGPFIFDLIPDRGPLGGLHAALAYAKSEWIFVLACDYPFVSAEFISLLAEYVSEDFGAVVPEQSDGRLQPLCAFYRTAAARPVVEEIIEWPRVPPPLHEIVSRLNPRTVHPAEYAHVRGADEQFTNINTASDLEAAREIERKLSGEK